MQLQPDTERHRVIEGLSVLEDEDGTLSVQQVAAMDAARFKPLTRTFNEGPARTVYWFRFTLQRQASAPARWLLEISPPTLDDLRLYEQDDTGKFHERHTGHGLPFETRENDYLGFVFDLSLPDTTAHTYFLRMQNSGVNILQMTLWRPAAFSSAVQTEYLLMGLFYGGLGIALFYTLMYWRMFREPIYLYYIGTLLALLIDGLSNNGLILQYFLPNSPGLTYHLPELGTTLTHIFTMLFFREFFNIRIHSRPLYYHFTLGVIISMMAFASVFFGYFKYLMPPMELVALSLIPVGIRFAYRSARAGTLGGWPIFWAFVWLSAITTVTLLTMLGVLPGNLLLLFGWQYASLGYILFMQQGITAHLQHLQQQSESALAAATDAQRVAEEEKQRRHEQREFLSMVSHEIKTPLAVIDAAVQALQYQPTKWNTDITRRHERIRHAATQLNYLAEMALSRQRDDDQPLSPRLASVQIKSLLDDCVSAEAGLADRMTTTCPKDATCMCDRALMRIALGNLLNNAVKYATPSTPITLRAEKSSQEDRNGTLFIVENACADLPPDAPAMMFEQYWRGTNSVDKDGLGLGLSVVRNITLAHGGNVACVITPGQVQISLWIPELNYHDSDHSRRG